MPPPVTGSDTRQRILETGARLIAAKSYNGCGLNEILQEAGVPKGSFYHYFASKEDFGIALIERARDEYVEQLKPILGDRRKSPLGRLRSVFEDHREELATNGPSRECLIPKMALETSQLSEPVRNAVKGAYDSWTAILAQAVRDAQAAGEIGRKHDADRLAKILVMFWEGAAIRMQIDGSIGPIDDFLEFVFESDFLDGARR